MSKDENNTSLSEKELRAQIEEEVRSEVRAEYEEKLKTDTAAAAKAQKEAEERAAKLEAKLDKEFERQEKSVRSMLEKEKKVKIFIPENPLNPNEVVPVGLNGVIYAIPVGQEFDVPESIYKVWKYSFDKTREANKRMGDLLNKEIKILD